MVLIEKKESSLSVIRETRIEGNKILEIIIIKFRRTEYPHVVASVLSFFL